MNDERGFLERLFGLGDTDDESAEAFNNLSPKEKERILKGDDKESTKKDDNKRR